MKRLSLILLALCTLMVFSSSATDPTFNKENKTCKGISLDGRVKFVEHNATFKVYVAPSGGSADIIVLLNTSRYLSDCANWKTAEEERNSDFTIQFVGSNDDADFSIWFLDY